MGYRDVMRALCVVGVMTGGMAMAEPKAPGEGLTKRPLPPATWADGPSVAERAALDAWLAGLATEARVRLPVAITRGPLGGVQRATLYGTAKGDDPGVRLSLDDSRMGIALTTHLRDLCGEGSTCALWIDGRWRPEPVMPSLTVDAGTPVAVRRVGPVVDPAKPARPARAAPPGAKGPAKPK